MLSVRTGATTAERVRVAKAMRDGGIDTVEISGGHYEPRPGMVAQQPGKPWRDCHRATPTSANLPRIAPTAITVSI